jgi:membrane protease YdiL (CAAX protease family)
MTTFDWILLVLILASGPGLMILTGLMQKKYWTRLNWKRKTLFNAIGSIILALPLFYLGLPLKVTNLSLLGLDRFVWWWFPLSLGCACVLILLNAGIALLYQKILKVSEEKLVSSDRTAFFEGMTRTRTRSVLMLGFGGIIAPLCEELYFRGLLLAWFLNYFPPWVGIAATAIVFGIAHFDSVGVIITGAIDGIGLSILFLIFGSLWVPILVHVFNNTVGIVAYMIESGKVKSVSETVGNNPAPDVSNDDETNIIVGEERQDIDEEKVQIRPEQDTAR